VALGHHHQAFRAMRARADSPTLRLSCNDARRRAITMEGDSMVFHPSYGPVFVSDQVSYLNDWLGHQANQHRVAQARHTPRVGEQP
jgi:hypothetical protein